jgi:hypothetical protein
MNELNDTAFEKSPMPFKPFTLWETKFNGAYLIDKTNKHISAINLGTTN